MLKDIVPASSPLGRAKESGCSQAQTSGWTGWPGAACLIVGAEVITRPHWHRCCHTFSPFPVGPHSPKLYTHSFIQNSLLISCYVPDIAGGTAVSRKREVSPVPTAQSNLRAAVLALSRGQLCGGKRVKDDGGCAGSETRAGVLDGKSRS